MNACQRNDSLLRKLAAEGASLSKIGREIGTNKRHVKAYILSQNIPHQEFGQCSMEHNSNWKGGRRIDEDGYVLIKKPDHPYCDRHGYVREHRLVMEQVLGRYLLPGEVVHHKEEGNKQNNSPDNLELFSTNAEHLAKELAGRIPNWTPEGLVRIREGVQKSVVNRQTSIHPK